MSDPSSELQALPPISSSSEPDSPLKSILKPTQLNLDESHEDAVDGPALLTAPTGDNAAAPLTREEESRFNLARERMRLQSLAMESPTDEMIANRRLPKKNLSALIGSSPDPTKSSASTSSGSSSKSKPSDWNKENLPAPGSRSQDVSTPKSSLYKSKSVGNIMKRPLTPCENNVFRIRRRPSLFGAGSKRSMSVDDEANSPKLQKCNDGTPKAAQTEAAAPGTSASTPTSSTTKRMASMPLIAAPKFHRSYSETHAAVIKRACNLAQKPNMTADMRMELALPTMSSGKKHQDLNTINCHSMAKLLRGEFAHTVSSFRVIDARYVYEYKGGHIVGAENFGAWDEQAFFDAFLPEGMGEKTIESLTHLASIAEEQDENKKNEQDDLMEQGEPQPKQPELPEKRPIVIFHCEFSSQRGPALMKELRKKDRTVNHNSYPALHYPEMYLLHNGYKEFWENYPDLCEPKGYQLMKDAAFHAEEKSFRKKSKSWAATGGGGTVARTGASASRLFKF